MSESDVWDLLIKHIQTAWPNECLHWNESPLELVTRLIDERNDAVHAIGEWAQQRWAEEVRDRPHVNIYRHPLDTTWRQVMRRCGVAEPENGHDREEFVPCSVPCDSPA